MHRCVAFAIAALITIGGRDAVAFSYCAKTLSAAGDVFAWRVQSGVVGDQFNPVTNFGENNSLDAYAAPFSNPSSCAVVFDANSFTLASAPTVASIRL
jgi:hypothetical protein